MSNPKENKSPQHVYGTPDTTSPAYLAARERERRAAAAKAEHDAALNGLLALLANFAAAANLTPVQRAAAKDAVLAYRVANARLKRL